VPKHDSSPLRAAAAKQLAHDPDPATAKALVAATKDKKWQVRAAALEAIAQRDDSSLLDEIAPALSDEKDVVRFTAAACVAHLTDTPAKKDKAKP
jgi:HEAT repeat protein